MTMFYKKIIQFLFFTYCVGFFQISLAQKVTVINQKGTKIAVNNNKVYTTDIDPNTSAGAVLENDVWINNISIPNTIKIFNGTTWVELTHTGTPGSVFFAGTNGVPTEKNSDFFWDTATNTLKATNVNIPGTLLDSSGQSGALNQVLSSTGNGTKWVDATSTSSTLTIKKDTIGYVFAAAHTQANGTNSFNINCSVTKPINETGKYKVTFDTPHPNGANYDIALGTGYNNSYSRIASVVAGSQKSTGFDVIVTQRSNGNQEDSTVDEVWYFNTSATKVVVTDVTQSSTPTTGSGITTGGDLITDFTYTLNDNNSGSYYFQLGFNSGSKATSYKILLDNVPYRLTNFTLGDHTVIEQKNTDETYDYLFTSTSPIGANSQYRQIIANKSIPGIGNACGCVKFYVN